MKDFITKCQLNSEKLFLFFSFDLDPRVRHTFFSTMIGASFYWVGLNAAQATLQRLLAVPTQNDALK